MKIWRIGEDKGERYLSKVETRAGAVLSPAVEERVRKVVDAVARRGDRALVSLIRRFDLKGMEFADFRLRGTVGAPEELGEEFTGAVEMAIANIKAFHEPQLPKGYNLDRDGSDLAIRVRPLDSVGVYVPGGAAVYLSSLLMAVIPARLAGVKRIAVATPPRAFLSSPHLRYILDRLDLREVYLMGGAHAVAALAHGTESVTAVDKVVGPGGKWVAAAKRAVYGVVDIDTIAGPSELVVVADAHADPDIVAADLLAQAEHGSGHERVWLVTTSGRLLKAVLGEIDRQLPTLRRREFIERALANHGWLIQVRTLEDGIALANRLAPEHCEIITRQARKVSERILTAGAIFLGSWSPTVVGDYLAGPSHTLPTGGAGASFAGLTVDQFQRRTSVVEYTAAALRKSLPTIAKFAEVEGLDAHGRSAAIRVETKRSRK